MQQFGRGSAAAPQQNASSGTWRLGRGERERSASHAPHEALMRYGDLVGTSPAFRALVHQLRLVEGSLAPVLIQGESGSGKELVARAIHSHSTTRRGPFVAVNCGGLDAAMFRSELFGHEKGAFTGAIRRAPGAFVAAEGGTLFLDEVGELPLELQPALLRALEQRAVCPVGSHRERPVNTRLLFATNRDLKQEVAEGRFREDLFYRIHVVEVRVPPLRERKEDLVPLAQACAARLGLGALPSVFKASLAARDWPGNVRELRNAVEAFGILGCVPVLQVHDHDVVERALHSQLDVAGDYAEQKAQYLAMFGRVYLRKLLQQTGGNVSQASRLSGLDRTYIGRMALKLGVEYRRGG